jgi:hypothetical protein
MIKTNSNAPPARTSVGPATNRGPRFSESVRWPHTRSIGPGYTRRMRHVPAAITSPESSGFVRSGLALSWNWVRRLPRRTAIPGTQQGVQRRKTPSPERAVRVDPCGRIVQRLRVKRQEMFAPRAASFHKMRALKHADVLRDGVERHGERLGEFGHPRLAAGQPLEDRAARGICQGDQGLVELGLRRAHSYTFTLTVEY